ncbi:unnamed protein product [Allacma fusca]|uniref:CRAL-TRIO domain-containing protein n=1 Tax=Allacma fusca TaxID=39272 RepID=A0A8J2NLS9_9HEXA|nr:unnamed protein product [Allacma fusca]
MRAVSVLILLLSLTTGLLAQLSEEEIPQSLRYILHLDLEKWEEPEELTKNLVYYLSGFDFENRPVWVVEFGKWDLRSILERGEIWDKLFDKYVDKFLWRLWKSLPIKATPEKPVKECVVIFDMEGYDLQQMNSPAALGFIIKKLRTVTAAIPITSGAYIINANFLAKNLLNLLRPVLGKEFSRVEIYGANSKSYRRVLLRNIPQNQLPESYGGSKGSKPVQIYG